VNLKHDLSLHWLHLLLVLDTGQAFGADYRSMILMLNAKDLAQHFNQSKVYIVPYSQSQLQHAVNGFDNLIIRVECLLENQPLKTLDNPEDQENLTKACVINLVSLLKKRSSVLLRKNF